MSSEAIETIYRELVEFRQAVNLPPHNPYRTDAAILHYTLDHLHSQGFTLGSSNHLPNISSVGSFGPEAHMPPLTRLCI
jgi:hypothetical protein